MGAGLSLHMNHQLKWVIAGIHVLLMLAPMLADAQTPSQVLLQVSPDESSLDENGKSSANQSDGDVDTDAGDDKSGVETAAITDNSGLDRWFVTRGSASFGPYTETEISKMIQSGSVTRYTMVLEENTTLWRKAKEVFDFSTMPQLRWFVMQNAVTTGPYTEDDLALKIENGVVQLDARIRRLDSDTWVKATSVYVFPRSAYTRQEKLNQKKQDSRNRKYMTTQYDQMQSSDDLYLADKASNVQAANAFAGAGMVGSFAGLAFQISGISQGNATHLTLGVALSIGFGTMRFIGALTSGIAASRYAKKTGKDFSWILFGVGWVSGVAGNMFVALAANSEDISNGVIFGTAIVSQIVLTAAWAVHCINTAELTAGHRSNGKAVSSSSFAVLPVYDPVAHSLGVTFNMQY